MNSIVRTVRVAPELPADIFRIAMRELVGGVTVLTAGHGEDVSGMTVTSLSSLSAEPPRVLIAVNRQASSYPLMKRHGFFGLSILGADQQAIAERFSDKSLKGRERFAGARWITLTSGAPLLADALAAIDCQIEEIIPRHSHAIVIGKLLDIRVTADASGALGYWRGRYEKLGDLDLAFDSRGLW